MGISNLYKTLSAYAVNTSLSQFQGKVVAIDMYAWLHRASYGCARELCEGKKPMQLYTFCLKRLRDLIRRDIRPIMVFDGASLPAKKKTAEDRRAQRMNKRVEAFQFLSNGDMQKAEECFQQAVEITPDIAHELAVLSKKYFPEVSVIVAPYEADAQLAFLARAGYCDAVITEDSDLLAYGCPCVISKLDKNGLCQVYYLNEFFEKQLPSDNGAKKGSLSFYRFSYTQFLDFCILCGCDYIPNIPTVGPVRAHDLVKKFKSGSRVLEIVRVNPKYKKLSPPSPYENWRDFKVAFEQSRLTFLFHIVFDPAAGEHVYLEEALRRRGKPTESVDPSTSASSADALLGQMAEPEIARRVACFLLHPETKRPFKRKTRNAATDAVDPELETGLAFSEADLLEQLSLEEVQSGAAVSASSSAPSQLHAGGMTFSSSLSRVSTSSIVERMMESISANLHVSIADESLFESRPPTPSPNSSDFGNGVDENGTTAVKQSQSDESHLVESTQIASPEEWYDDEGTWDAEHPAVEEADGEDAERAEAAAKVETVQTSLQSASAATPSKRASTDGDEASSPQKTETTRRKRPLSSATANERVQRRSAHILEEAMKDKSGLLARTRVIEVEEETLIKKKMTSPFARKKGGGVSSASTLARALFGATSTTIDPKSDQQTTMTNSPTTSSLADSQRKEGDGEEQDGTQQRELQQQKEEGEGGEKKKVSPESKGTARKEMDDVVKGNSLTPSQKENGTKKRKIDAGEGSNSSTKRKSSEGQRKEEEREEERENKMEEDLATPSKDSTAVDPVATPPPKEPEGRAKGKPGRRPGGQNGRVKKAIAAQKRTIASFFQKTKETAA